MQKHIVVVLPHHVVLVVVHHRQLDEVAAENVTDGIQVEGINHAMEDQHMVVEVLIFWKGKGKKDNF